MVLWWCHCYSVERCCSPAQGGSGQWVQTVSILLWPNCHLERRVCVYTIEGFICVHYTLSNFAGPTQDSITWSLRSTQHDCYTSKEGRYVGLHMGPIHVLGFCMCRKIFVLMRWSWGGSTSTLEMYLSWIWAWRLFRCVYIHTVCVTLHIRMMILRIHESYLSSMCTLRFITTHL